MKALCAAVCGAAAFAMSFAAATSAEPANEPPPPWAWGFTTPPSPTDAAKAAAATAAAAAAPVPQQREAPKHTVDGSKFSFTRLETSNRYGPADWFPTEHPAMPDIVAHGREAANPQIWACSLCHLTDGRGRPENANLTGLPYDYIVRQLMDFKHGLRRTSDPRKVNTALMEGFGKSLTDDEIMAAATYFSSIPAPAMVKVVESTTTPKTRPNGGVFLTITGAGAGTEPLGDRIIETPVSAEDFEFWRNPHGSYVAYVPPGSVAKGKTLVTTGTTTSGAKVTQCTVCHGSDLRGLGPVPRLAGRSPSYVARQLYDMKHGNRVGAWTPLMAPVVDKLTDDDMLVIAAYVASLEP